MLSIHFLGFYVTVVGRADVNWEETQTKSVGTTDDKSVEFVTGEIHFEYSGTYLSANNPNFRELVGTGRLLRCGNLLFRSQERSNNYTSAGNS